MSYNAGSALPDSTPRFYGAIHAEALSPAYNSDGGPGEGAEVTETRRPAKPDRLAGRDAGQPRAGSCLARARSCASTTSRAIGPWPWPPTPASVGSPTSKPTAGCKNAATTASGARKRSRALRSGGSPVELDRFALQGCAVSRVGAFSRPRPAGLPAFYQMLTLAGTPPGAGNPRRYACH